MSLKRIAVAFALATAALCRMSAVIVTAIEAAAAAVESFVALGFALLSRRSPVLAGNGGFTGLLVRDDYDAPPQHALRHEAGTSRRSAARNI
jgi:hypothetical protein